MPLQNPQIGEGWRVYGVISRYVRILRVLSAQVPPPGNAEGPAPRGSRPFGLGAARRGRAPQPARYFASFSRMPLSVCDGRMTAEVFSSSGR